MSATSSGTLFCYTELINGSLRDVIDSASLEDKLRSSVSYAVLSGGKRIRPLLALAICHDLGGDPQTLVRTAIALELMHVASLVHDDLPALDDDDLRRGQPSCHKAFGEGTAVLTGDILPAVANSLILNSEYSDGVKIRLLKTLNDSYARVCRGQVLDLIGPRNKEELEKVRILKTSALFVAAATFGVVGSLEVPPPDILEAAKEFGNSLGNYFQVVDDYIDVFGSNLVRGREYSSDTKNRRMTDFSKTDRKAAGNIHLEAYNRLIGELVEFEELAGVWRGEVVPLNTVREVVEMISGRVE